MKLCVPKYAAHVALPQSLQIPVAISIACNWPRVFLVKHGVAIPQGVVEWMLQDRRYAHWFAENPLSQVVTEPVVAEPVVTEPVVETEVVVEPVVTEPVVEPEVVAEPEGTEPVVEPEVVEPEVVEPAQNRGRKGKKP